MPKINYQLLHAITQKIIQRKKLLIIALIISKTRKYKKKRFWTSHFLSKRKTHGAHYTTVPTLLRHSDLFMNYCRISKTQFENLLTLIAPKIIKQMFICEPISPDQRLLLTLRYLAFGDSMMSLKYQHYISQSAITNIIKETCNALWTVLVGTVLKIPTHDTWKQIAQNFELKCNFPHCLGVDGKHVVVQAPPHSGSTFYNYKSSHGIVLMAVCDSDYKFVLVDIGAAGRQSDGGIWSRSTMGQAFAEGQIEIPLPDRVTEGPILPYVMVADEAFQLTRYMMRPFPGKDLTKEKGIFNYRLSRARRIVECTFGILSSQWRIFKRPINTSIETAISIVKATIVLHNYRRQNKEDIYGLQESINAVDVLTCFEEAAAFSNIGSFGSNTHTREASEIRNMFVDYFNNEGSVSWQ